MQKIVLIKNKELYEVNNLLNEGWIVKHISSTHETISIDGATHYHNETGNVFAYIVLEK